MVKVLSHDRAWCFSSGISDLRQEASTDTLKTLLLKKKKLLSENKEHWPEYADQLAVAQVKAGFGQLHKKVSSSTKPGS